MTHIRSTERSSNRRPSHGGLRRAIAGGMATLLAAGVLVLGATPAQAAPIPVSNAEFAWGLNQESGSGAFFGGCNFLSAGAAGNTGSSRLWTQADGFYQSNTGNVSVRKATAGGWATPSWTTKCQDGTVNPAVAVTTGNNRHTGNQVVISSGTGTIDPAANTASISWTGSFTVAYYGGMTYWTATNPVLTVNADGSGTVTATATGYGADMAVPEQWNTLPPTTIILADLTGVDVTATGFAVLPDYLGVAVTSTGVPQQPQLDGNPATWGSFPQSFVDFQEDTGQSSYWYSSAGARDAAKPATALTVTIPAAPTGPTIVNPPVSKTITLGNAYAFTVSAAGTGNSYQWQRLTGSTWANIGGATGSALTGTPTSTSATGSKFRVRISNNGVTVDSTAVTLTINKAAPTVTLALPASSHYGKSAKATVTVKGPAGVAATGTVILKVGSAVIGTGTLAAGKATVALKSTLGIGNRTVTAAYAGNSNLLAKSVTKALVVKKATSTTTIKLAAATISSGAKGKVAVSVAVTGVVPTGAVTVKSGSTTVGTLTLTAAHRGKATVTIRVLSKGSHRITASYAGTASIAADPSPVSILTVK